MLSAKGIHKYYGDLHVLKGVDIELSAGEVVTVVGASGAGKSTLLQILGTLDHADEGEILFEGKSVRGFKDGEEARFRNQSLGFVFQFHHLLPEFTALENVSMPARIAGTAISEVEAYGKELLDMLGLKDRIDHKPSQLSGGEQQRVAVARALINRPKLILADEPTGNLDTQNSEEIYRLIFELAQNTGVSFLIATHNMEFAQRANRCIRIVDGKVDAK